MHLYIDPRAGSNKLIEKFPGECESMMLDAGDIAFFGNGPDDEPLWIGIEYKQMNDIVACIKDGRFTGTQLPNMMKDFDVCFLLVEGILRPDAKTGQLLRYAGKSNSFSLGISYRAYDNFLTSVSLFSAMSGKPCIIKTAGNSLETLNIIRDTYEFFQKPWEDHVSMRQPDSTKMHRVTFDFSQMREPEPGSAEYPKHILRKSIFQIDRIGWDIAGEIAEKFGTMDSLLAASQKDLIIEKTGKKRGVGNVLAARIFEALHGYADPLAIKKKRTIKKVDTQDCDPDNSSEGRVFL